MNRQSNALKAGPPLLEDPTYPGRTGGYVTRITGKLLQESAIAGHRELFLPSPTKANNSYVYVGSDVTGAPLFEVPGEFYAPVFARVGALFGPDTVDATGERTLTYSDRSFAISIDHAPASGLTLRIRRVSEGDASRGKT
ncbi:MAG: hypothetical protein JSR41_25925 [Proteobacteria bacterium]|nr:hypothetical protein [Pseudomonadota bacterium]